MVCGGSKTIKLKSYCVGSVYHGEYKSKTHFFRLKFPRMIAFPNSPQYNVSLNINLLLLHKILIFLSIYNSMNCKFEPGLIFEAINKIEVSQQSLNCCSLLPSSLLVLRWWRFAATVWYKIIYSDCFHYDDDHYLPSRAWNSLDLKIRMTRSMAIRRVRSCGADKREW